MRDEQQRVSIAHELCHPLDAFDLKGRIADRKSLVHDEDVGIQVRCYREAETELHPRREELHRRINCS